MCDRSTDLSRSLLSTGLFSDFTITCQDRTFNVHKAILLDRGGDFFIRAICAGFVESVTSTVDLPEDDPMTVSQILQYIYTSEYPDPSPSTQAARKQSETTGSDADNNDGLGDLTEEEMASLAACRLHVRLFAAAAKYSVTPLKEEARKRFVLDLEQLTFWYSFEELVGIRDIFHEIYSTTAQSERALRDYATYVTVLERDKHAGTAGRRSKALLDTIRSIPELGVDMATGSLQKVDRCWKCNRCGQKQVVFLFPCHCNVSTRCCDEAKCLELYNTRLQCRRCGRIGTMDPPKKR